MDPIVQGLIMTAIGMGLVFVAILALWWMMDVMVKITTDRSQTVTHLNIARTDGPVSSSDAQFRGVNNPG